MRNRIVIGAFVLLVLIAGGVKTSKYLKRQQLIRQQEHVQIPLPESRASSAALSSTSFSMAMTSSVASFAQSSSAAIRDAVNWNVPFTSQAPTGNWDALHEEACEEASVLMVLRYFHGTSIGSSQQADDAIVDLVAKNEALGFPVDDTAVQIVTLIHSLDPAIEATLLKNPTEEQLKEVLSAGSLVIVPAAGRDLGNPYYTAPGPLYHMLVIRGYTRDGYVITNDPGTKRGANYVYRWAVLLDAMHDWNGGDVEHGQRVVIVVGR